MMRIGIVAGEASGDMLGAGLIRALQERRSDLHFEGIAGPRMQAAGAVSLFPMERLSVMGLTEVLGRYCELLGIQRQLIRHFLSTRPAAVIGIDAPDFNLGMERRLRAAGIRTIHYVSPSVWAWRQYRIRKIARSVDLMLTLFPFEADFYRSHKVPVRYVGHPLADMLPLTPDREAARRALGLEGAGEIVALLPGSRRHEVESLGPLFLQAARLCHEQRPDLHFIAPMATAALRQRFAGLAQPYCLPLTLIDGHSHEAMTAADVVLLASGTAALEAALLKRPHVVAYKLSAMTGWLARRLLKIRHYALPNLLAGDAIVPELMQDRARPDAMAQAVLQYLREPARTAELQSRFSEIHRQLRQNADQQAATAVLELIGAS